MKTERITKTQTECFILTPIGDAESTIAYLEKEKLRRAHENGDFQIGVELQIRFNTGAKIDATFPKRAEAIAFLRGFA